MAERRKPLDEIEKLRKEIEALRQEHESSSEKPEKEKAGRSFTGELGEFSKHAEKLLEGVEQAATRHPLPTVAAALMIGLILGRITSR